ncbi:hypothetical protein BGZ92_008963 [Podila epicladia]|nr:hypothetical protein BGZ92_008963 [Podila epicladia]
MCKNNYIRDNLTKINTMNSSNNKERYGYDAILIARPDFCNALLSRSRLPKERTHWGKRVVQFHQSQDGVQVECQEDWDDSTGSEVTVIYKGGILIGTDSAYPASAVDCMIDSMTKQRIQLPAEDLEGLQFSSSCVIGANEFCCDITSVTRWIGLSSMMRNTDWKLAAKDELCDQVRIF